ncbi:hypothetical protein MINTM018_53060 (plasmid) [Mycobacterium intracellulare]|uniref:Uncharacterized protein n=1 Tax=Mycobacterium intracellulare TaxID=1767 RepID=A0A7R7MYX8_MYCIT|nr:hypothetical protein MINTM018_53060 [Mycobacterium intracellulare]
MDETDELIGNILEVWETCWHHGSQQAVYNNFGSHLRSELKRKGILIVREA